MTALLFLGSQWFLGAPASAKKCVGSNYGLESHDANQYYCLQLLGLLIFTLPAREVTYSTPSETITYSTPSETHSIHVWYVYLHLP